jgi:glyoxylase-like metal-dependent hydrolase (beta-lactamase superfamily II)
MFEISRRDMILGAAGAGLFLGLDKPVAFIGAAQAQRAADSFKYKVGDIEAFSLNEGSVPRTVDASFVKNASIDDVKAALSKGGLGETFQNPFTVTALRTGGKTVLIDSGFGGNGAPSVGKMADNMKAAGLDPAKVDVVLISHFHGDHISGLWMKETNEPVFPNAEIMMPETEYKFFTDASVIEKLPEGVRNHVRRIQSTFPGWKNIKQFADGAEVAPGVRALATPGHTVGHTSFVIASGGQQLIVVGDAVTIPALFAANPGWHVMFDANGAQAEETRRKLMDRVVADKAMVAGYHFGFPNVGTLAKDGNGYAFTAVKA